MGDEERGELIFRTFNPASTYGAESLLNPAYRDMDEVRALNRRLLELGQELELIRQGIRTPYQAIYDMRDDLEGNRSELFTDIDHALLKASESAYDSESYEDMGSVACAYFNFLKAQYDGLSADTSAHPLTETAEVSQLKLLSLMPGVPVVLDIDTDEPYAGIVAQPPKLYLARLEDGEVQCWPENNSGLVLGGYVKLRRFDDTEEVDFYLAEVSYMAVGSLAINNFVELYAPSCLDEGLDPGEYFADVVDLARYYKPGRLDDPVLGGELDLSPVLNL